MLALRLRRWPNIKPGLVQSFVFAGYRYSRYNHANISTALWQDTAEWPNVKKSVLFRGNSAFRQGGGGSLMWNCLIMCKTVLICSSQLGLIGYPPEKMWVWNIYFRAIFLVSDPPHLKLKNGGQDSGPPFFDLPLAISVYILRLWITTHQRKVPRLLTFMARS